MNETTSATKRPSWLKQLFIALIVLGLGFGGYTLLVSSKPKTEPSPTEERSWNVSVMPIIPGNHKPILKIYGQITTQVDSQITATIDAFVESLEVAEGDNVSQYEVLVSLDRSDIELNYQQQLGARNAINADIGAEKVRYQSDINAIKNERSLVALTKKTVDRYRALKGKNLSSELQLEDAERSYQQQLLSLNSRQMAINEHPNRIAKLEANLLQAQASLDKAHLDLQRTEVSAPFDGRVSEVLIAPGERVNKGTPLLRLYSTDALELKAQIPSRYLPVIRQALSTGDSVTAKGLLGNQHYEFILDRLASEIRSGQGGVFGFFTLTTPNSGIELGRSIELNLHLPNVTDAITVPPQALYGTHRLYKVEDNRLVSVDVERLGEATNGNNLEVLIKSDQLKTGDSIITTQLPTAVNGLKVSVVESNE